VAPCASQHVSDSACTAVRTSCSPPLRLANNIPHEWPSMLEIDHRCDSHISLRGALPLYVRIGRRLHTKDWVGEPVSEQLSVDESVLRKIFLYFSGLCGFQREYPISQVALVGCHPGFSSFDQVGLQ